MIGKKIYCVLDRTNVSQKRPQLYGLIGDVTDYSFNNSKETFKVLFNHGEEDLHYTWLKEIPEGLQNESVETIRLYFAL